MSFFANKDALYAHDYVFISTESRSYEIQVLTSGHEEITVIRLSPNAIQQAVEETFRQSINVSNFCLTKTCWEYINNRPLFINI